MTAVRRLTERTLPFAAPGEADTSAPGVARNVVLCGLESANGRVYPAPVLKAALAKYENKPVFIDHGRGERGVREWFGEVRNVTLRPDGRPQGDIHYPAGHSFAAEFRDRAKNFPRSLGMSHVALAKTRRGDDGREVVESIEEIESVDLVASPATNPNGLHESRGPTVFTWKRLAEWVTRHPKSTTGQIARVKRFAEDEAMGEMPALDAEPAADAEPDDTITAALQQAGHDAWDKCVAGEMTIQELMSKLKDILKDHGKYKGEPADEPEPAAKESRKPVDSWTVLAECQKAGYQQPRPSQLKVLSLMHEAADRAEFIKDCLDAHRGGAEKPESASRHATAGLREERDAHRQVAEGRDGKTEPAGPLSLSEGPLGWSIN
jgi:hypothetical protein